MKSPKHLILEKIESSLWIFLNRPEVQNAFNLEMASELLTSLRDGMKDRSVTTIVLSGKGKAFSAGGDIKLMGRTKNHKKFFLEISRLVHAAVLEMRRGEKPVLAAIPGYVGGIAFGAVLGTDLRIASTQARFNAATIRIGLVANGGATYYLPRMTGLARASEILFLGDILSADKALEIGLVNRLVSPDQLNAVTQDLANRLSQTPRKALARLKKILDQGLTATLPTQLERERQSIAWSSTTRDFKEGITAFLEKRKPVFNQ